MDKKNLVIVLVVVALLLGFLVLNKDKSNSPSVAVNQTGQNAGGEAPLGSGEVGERTYPASFGDDEKSVVNVPFNGTTEEQQAHFDLASRMAVAGDEVAVSNCYGDPLVLRFSLKDKLKISNPDSVDHKIIFDAETSVVVKAGETKTVDGAFEKGAGLYGFGCDSLPGTAGLFLVTE